LLKKLKIEFLINSVLISFVFYLFFITLRDFFIKKSSSFSQNITHFGFSLFLLSIIFNNLFTSEVITNLKVGDTFKSEKFKIYFENLDQKKEKNFQSIVGKFVVENLNGEKEVMMPELRIYNQPNMVTSEAFIKTNFFSDKFMTMNLVQNQEYLNIRYQIKPLMIWIWISILMITTGGLISLLRKNEN
tara:strand:- start:1456 stop:2019 length:564 start_codon:yes stop_codon:yes gene_type:complete